MTEILTFLAEEIVRATTLIWSGIRIAVKLNYEVMSIVVEVATRMVQLLLLLNQKTVQLASILFQDSLLFLSDIGGWVLTASSGIHWLLCGLSNASVAILSSAIWFGSNVLYGLTCMKILLGDGIFKFFDLLEILLILSRDAFVLFGSSIMFAVLFIPSIIQICSKIIYKFVLELPVKGKVMFQDMAKSFQEVVKRFHFYLWKLFNDIPSQAVFGVLLGLTIVVAFKYIYRYVKLHASFELNPISYIYDFQHRISNWSFEAIRELFRTQRTENDNIIVPNYETIDENDNDNNGNVPDQNLPSSAGHIAPSSSVSTSRSNHVNEDVYSVQALRRRPIRRSQRLIGLNRDITEDEVKEDNSNIVQNGISSKEKGLGWATELYKKLEDEREDKLCIICQDKLKKVILLPCRHLCLCEACRSAIITKDNNCPICRNPILDSLKVYL